MTDPAPGDEHGTIMVRIGAVAYLRGMHSPSVLSRHLGISRQATSNLLKAQSSKDISSITFETLERLCHVLKATPGSLLIYAPKGQPSLGAHDDAETPDDDSAPAVTSPPG